MPGPIDMHTHCAEGDYQQDDELNQRIRRALDELSKSFSIGEATKRRSVKALKDNGADSHGVFEIELDKLSFEKMVGKGASSKVYR